MNTVDLRKWTPTIDITDHGGASLPAKMVFFSQPPNEIGAVLSAYSNLSEEEKNVSRSVQCVLVLLLSAGLAEFVVFVGGDFYWGVGLGLLTFVVGYFTNLYVKTNTFVGSEGVARFTTKDLNKPPVIEITLFKDISNLKKEATSFYRGSFGTIYRSTQYKFTFRRADNHCDCNIAGVYQSEEGNPPTTDAYWFGKQAERVWNYHKGASLLSQLEKLGFVEFPVNRSGFVRVSSTYIELKLKGNVERCDRVDLEEMSIWAGIICIQRKDAKWFSNAGKYSLKVAEVGNVDLFFKFLDYFDYELKSY